MVYINDDIIFYDKLHTAVRNFLFKLCGQSVDSCHSVVTYVIKTRSSYVISGIRA